MSPRKISSVVVFVSLMLVGCLADDVSARWNYAAAPPVVGHVSNRLQALAKFVDPTTGALTAYSLKSAPMTLAKYPWHLLDDGLAPTHSPITSLSTRIDPNGPEAAGHLPAFNPVIIVASKGWRYDALSDSMFPTANPTRTIGDPNNVWPYSMPYQNWERVKTIAVAGGSWDKITIRIGASKMTKSSATYTGTGFETTTPGNFKADFIMSRLYERSTIHPCTIYEPCNDIRNRAAGSCDPEDDPLDCILSGDCREPAGTKGQNARISPLVGTVKATFGNSDITGTGTRFLTDLKAGTQIYIIGPGNNAWTGIVLTVFSDTLFSIAFGTYQGNSGTGLRISLSGCNGRRGDRNGAQCRLGHKCCNRDAVDRHVCPFTTPYTTPALASSFATTNQPETKCANLKNTFCSGVHYDVNRQDETPAVDQAFSHHFPANDGSGPTQRPFAMVVFWMFRSSQYLAVNPGAPEVASPFTTRPAPFLSTDTYPLHNLMPSDYEARKIATNVPDAPNVPTECHDPVVMCGDDWSGPNCDLPQSQGNAPMAVLNALRYTAPLASRKYSKRVDCPRNFAELTPSSLNKPPPVPVHSFQTEYGSGEIEFDSGLYKQRYTCHQSGARYLEAVGGYGWGSGFQTTIGAPTRYCFHTVTAVDPSGAATPPEGEFCKLVGGTSESVGCTCNLDMATGLQQGGLNSDGDPGGRFAGPSCEVDKVFACDYVSGTRSSALRHVSAWPGHAARFPNSCNNPQFHNPTGMCNGRGECRRDIASGLLGYQSYYGCTCTAGFGGATRNYFNGDFRIQTSLGTFCDAENLPGCNHPECLAIPPNSGPSCYFPEPFCRSASLFSYTSQCSSPGGVCPASGSPLNTFTPPCLDTNEATVPVSDTRLWDWRDPGATKDVCTCSDSPTELCSMDFEEFRTVFLPAFGKTFGAHLDVIMQFIEPIEPYSGAAPRPAYSSKAGTNAFLHYPWYPFNRAKTSPTNPVPAFRPEDTFPVNNGAGDQHWKFDPNGPFGGAYYSSVDQLPDEAWPFMMPHAGWTKDREKGGPVTSPFFGPGVPLWLRFSTRIGTSEQFVVPGFEDRITRQTTDDTPVWRTGQTFSRSTIHPCTTYEPCNDVCRRSGTEMSAGDCDPLDDMDNCFNSPSSSCVSTDTLPSAGISEGVVRCSTRCGEDAEEADCGPTNGCGDFFNGDMCGDASGSGAQPCCAGDLCSTSQQVNSKCRNKDNIVCQAYKAFLGNPDRLPHTPAYTEAHSHRFDDPTSPPGTKQMPYAVGIFWINTLTLHTPNHADRAADSDLHFPLVMCGDDWSGPNCDRPAQQGNADLGTLNLAKNKFFSRRVDCPDGDTDMEPPRDHVFDDDPTGEGSGPGIGLYSSRHICRASGARYLAPAQEILSNVYFRYCYHTVTSADPNAVNTPATGQFCRFAPTCTCNLDMATGLQIAGLDSQGDPAGRFGGDQCEVDKAFACGFREGPFSFSFDMEWTAAWPGREEHGAPGCGVHANDFDDPTKLCRGRGTCLRDHSVPPVEFVPSVWGCVCEDDWYGGDYFGVPAQTGVPTMSPQTVTDRYTTARCDGTSPVCTDQAYADTCFPPSPLDGLNCGSFEPFCTLKITELHGAECQDLCGNIPPSTTSGGCCPPNSKCKDTSNVDSTVWDYRVDDIPSGPEVQCVCDPGYARFQPTQATPMTCITCQQSSSKTRNNVTPLDVIDCNSNGVCVIPAGIETSSVEPFCSCQEGFEGSGCEVPRTVSIDCGAHFSHNVVCTVFFPPGGTADPRYDCSFAGTITSTVPSVVRPFAFGPENVLNPADPVNLFKPTGTDGAPTPTPFLELLDTDALMCLEIRAKYGLDELCPLEFLNINDLTASQDGICTPSVPAQRLESSLFGYSHFCYLDSLASVEHFRCVNNQADLDRDIDCLLHVHHSEYVSDPGGLARVVITQCT